MKKVFIILIAFLLYQFCCFAQSTWINTPYMDFWWTTPYSFDSTNVGPLEMAVTPNGTILSLVQINENHETNLVAYDSTGNLLWSNPVGHSFTISEEYCYSLHSTGNNGCVYVLYHDTWGGPQNYTVFILNSNGTIQGQIQYSFPIGAPFKSVSVNTTNDNTTLIQIRDSLVVFDSSSTILVSRVPFTGSINVLTDTDFILTDSSKIIRENFYGGITWSINAPGYSVSGVNLTTIYANSADSLMKIDASSGMIYWTKQISFSKFSITNDDGFVVIRGSNNISTNEITKYDSSGNIQWTKNYPFPEFGYRAIIETQSKHYVTGGAWKNIDLIQFWKPAFSPFITQIDSAGKGVLDSTDFFFVGNANNNHNLSFGEDAVYIAAAMGNFGSPRDSLLRNVDDMNIYATQWSDSFNAGMNYRFSDYDGNGIIDTADVRKFAETYIYYGNYATPDYLKTSSHQSAPQLSFVFENDSMNYTDSIKVDVILGSSLSPIDSIYGLSFDLSLYGIHSNTPLMTSFYSIKPTSLGDTSVNLYSYFINRGQAPYISSMVLCRTDHMNAYVAGDTVTTLYFIAPANSTIMNPVFLNIIWNAITVGGYPVTLNLVSNSLILFGSTGINNLNNNEIKIFPNPADENLFFSFENNIVNEITVLDETGRIISSINNPENKYILNTKNYPDGIYYISALTENKILHTKFLVVH